MKIERKREARKRMARQYCPRPTPFFPDLIVWERAHPVKEESGRAVGDAPRLPARRRAVDACAREHEAPAWPDESSPDKRTPRGPARIARAARPPSRRPVVRA